MIQLPEEYQNIDVEKLSLKKKRELLVLLEALEDKKKHNRLETFYPDDGPFKRDLYIKHLEFFAAGAQYDERLFMAGNRTGKTTSGGYECAVHLTGRYPHWWEGRVFNKPIEFWAVGKTAETTRDIIQDSLLGKNSDTGSGLIPRDCIIGKPRPKAGGVPNSIDTVEVKWGGGGDISSGTSMLGFKNYAQGRGSFEGTFKNGIWCDEEPPIDVYNESMMRITSTDGSGRGGLIYVTFTPLQGMSEVVMSFLPREYSFSEAA